MNPRQIVLASALLSAFLLSSCGAEVTFPPTATTAGRAGQQNGQTILYDDFTDPDPGWGDPYSAEDSSYYFQNGKYFFNVLTEDYRLQNYIEYQMENSQVNVDVNIEQPATDGSVGVICRYQDHDNYYGLRISEDGLYSIYKRVDGEETAILDWTPSSLIPTDGSSFQLNATCQGTQLAVGINGRQLGQVMDTDLASGYVGLVTDTWQNGGLVISFDNYEVIQY